MTTHHPIDNRPQAAQGFATVGRSVAGSMGRQYAGGRDDEFQREECVPRGQREPEGHGAFTRVSDDMIDYKFTVEDPETWDRTWTASAAGEDRRADLRIRLPRDELRHLEYSCRRTG